MTELTDDELLIIWRFNFAKTNRRRFLDIARAAIAADRDLTAALAKPADGPAALPANFIDPEHSGTNREMLEEFYAATFCEGGTDDEITLRGINAVLARWGNHSADASTMVPPAEGPSDEELGLIYHDCCRGCEFMDQVGFEDAARAVLARWGQPPAPPAEGEVAELARWLRLRNPIDMEGEPDDCTYFMLTRAAELLERHAAMENLAADAVSGLRYIEQSAGRLYGVGWDRVFDAAATLQPAHALPLPQGGEVEP